ncbi:MAG: hypothetical protein KIT58_23430 [Planctomycetota bacterium]|nr:hypothetical protein [Planctomycetota bacterium]
MHPLTRAAGAGVVALALHALAAGPTRAQEAAPPLDRALRLKLFDPVSPPRNTLFYSGFGIPLLRRASVAPAGTLEPTLRTSRTHYAESGFVDGQKNRVDALFLEHLRIGVTLAVHDRVAVWLDVQVAGWDERRDVFRIHARGTPEFVIEGEESKARDGHATGRHENLSNVHLGTLVTWLRDPDGVSALGTSLLFKPKGNRRADITNSGTWDLALTMHGSLLLADTVALHANGGVVVPLGQPWIFESPREFHARYFFQGSGGVTVAVTDWLSLGAAIEGARSPWERTVRFIDRATLNASGGARLRLGRFFIDVGGGAGLIRGGSDWLFWVELGYVTEPLWGAGP